MRLGTETAEMFGWQVQKGETQLPRAKGFLPELSHEILLLYLAYTELPL